MSLAEGKGRVPREQERQRIDAQEPPIPGIKYASLECLAGPCSPVNLVILLLPLEAEPIRITAVVASGQ